MMRTTWKLTEKCQQMVFLCTEYVHDDNDINYLDCSTCYGNGQIRIGKINNIFFHLLPYLCVCVCVCVCVYVCMYVCMYIYMYVCMYVCIYIYTYTKTQFFHKQTNSSFNIGKIHNKHKTEHSLQHAYSLGRKGIQ